MKSNRRNRQLAFERLEPKAAPSTLLLLLVASPEGIAIEAEAAEVASYPGASQDPLAGPVNLADQTAESKWQYNHAPERLLRFIAENTAPDRGDLGVWQTPTQHQCDGADAMMKLGDDELRTMILFENAPSRAD